jgi:hypothetical protein
VGEEKPDETAMRDEVERAGASSARRKVEALPDWQ